jgi:hypothetical protein
MNFEFTVYLSPDRCFKKHHKLSIPLLYSRYSKNAKIARMGALVIPSKQSKERCAKSPILAILAFFRIGDNRIVDHHLKALYAPRIDRCFGIENNHIHESPSRRLAYSKSWQIIDLESRISVMFNLQSVIDRV